MNREPPDSRGRYAQVVAILDEAGITGGTRVPARGAPRPRCPPQMGVDVKVVSEILGHTQTWFTRDTHHETAGP